MKLFIRYLILLVPSLCMAEAPETLDRLISSALLTHPAVQGQQAQLQRSNAEVESANWQFFPTPSIAFEKARASASDSAYQGDGRVASVGLQQPLWTGGRLTAGKEKAEAGVIVSQASLAEVRQQLALRVVQAYSEWLAAHRKMQANEKNLATHVRLNEQVKRRVEQGASSESDVTLAVGRLKSVTADLSLARAQKEIALARLAQLAGRRIDDMRLSAAVAAPRPLDGNLQALLERAQAAHPAIARAQAQASVQESVIAERRAELSPEVYVRAERQYGNYTVRNAGPENRVFIGVSSHFGAGLSSVANIAGAKAQHQAALAEVDVQRRAISEQILADYALATSADNRLIALKESLAAAGDVARSYDRQFLAGRKSWLDVMNAAREQAQTEVQLADIEATQVIATWRLAIYTQSIDVSNGAGQ